MDLPDGNDPDSGVPVGHLEQFLQEVGLIGCLRAVVQVDLLACTVEASGHAEEWRDADAAGDPHLPPGGSAELEGPYGTFSHLALANSRQVWIAGGIGITPFLSMARSTLVWSPRA